MAQKVVRKSPRAPARRSKLPRLIALLVVLALVWVGYRHFQGPSSWSSIQYGLSFTLLVPDPMPPGFSLKSVSYEPDGQRQQVTKVTLEFMSGPEHFTLEEYQMTGAPAIPTTGPRGKLPDTADIGPYHVTMLPNGDGAILYFDYQLTRVVVQSASMDRQELKRVVEVLVIAR